MRSDITRTSVLDMRTNEYALRPVPPFAYVVHVEEINCVTPKTQSGA